MEDSDSDTLKPNTPTTRSNLGTKIRSRHKHKAIDRKPVQCSSETLEPAAAKGVNERSDNIDLGLSLSISQLEPPTSYWSRWETWVIIGVCVGTLSLIFGFPRVKESFPRNSGLQYALLPPRNILQPQNITVAKFDINALDLACRGSHLPVCDVPHLFRCLNWKLSQNDQEIKSLGSHLGVLLHSTKTATNKEECTYFPQLQLDINQARNRSYDIQGSLGATLKLNGKSVSYVSQSRSIAEQRKASATDSVGYSATRWVGYDTMEEAYTDSERWLGILDGYSQRLKIRDESLGWELKQQNWLQSDLKGVEGQIERLGIGQGAGNQTKSSCTAFNMQRVERRLIGIRMRAAEDNAAA